MDFVLDLVTPNNYPKDKQLNRLAKNIYSIASDKYEVSYVNLKYSEFLTVALPMQTLEAEDSSLDAKVFAVQDYMQDNHTPGAVSYICETDGDSVSNSVRFGIADPTLTISSLSLKDFENEARE